MKIVLDTNVLVSGLLSPAGRPADIVRLVAAGRLSLCHDARILLEYRAVLDRPRFRFDRSAVRSLLDQIEHGGEIVAAGPWRLRLTDRDDEKFLEVALAGGAAHLVTGNLRHFPADRREGISVVPPARFVDIYAGRG